MVETAKNSTQPATHGGASMTTEYCIRWTRQDQRRPIPLDVASAQERHDERRLYTALIGSWINPRCYVEVNDDYLAVGFLDDRGREYLLYQFEEIEPGRMFLTTATRRQFDSNGRRSMTASSSHFFETGELLVITEAHIPHAFSIEELELDVESNWEPYPEFGAYEGFVTLERGQFLPPVAPVLD
jgi:hypothetical protein